MITIPTFDILYEDEWLIVINKPCGILVHRTKISEDTQFVLQLLRKQIQQYVYPVHRLDRATSGVLIFGKSSEAANHLAEQFRNHQIEKNYLAIVRGHLDATGTIDYDLAPEKHKPAKSAITHYQRITQSELNTPVGLRYPTARYSLVKINLETGRRHQIRRHFAHIRHPIIGDKRHGDCKYNKYFSENYGLERMLLHASEAVFSYGEKEDKIHVSAPLDATFLKTIDLLNLNPPILHT